MIWPQKHKSCRRFNYPGDAHSPTFSCFRRIPLLSRDRSRQWFIDAMHEAKRRFEFDLWAYMLMPEHVHLLIFPRREVYSISAILTAVKKPVTLAALRWLEAHAPAFLPRLLDGQPSGKSAYRFWQRGGGYDRNMIEPETIHAEINYIHMNPVRRELAGEPNGWMYSSALYFAGQQNVPVIPDVHSIPGYC